MLIEKAYAKVFSGYQNIESGNVPDTIQDLTGAPYSTYDLTEDNNIFETLKDSISKGFITTSCCSKEKTLQGRFESIGLIPQYSYTILSYKEFEYQGKNEQVLELRNPWGWFGNEWKGRWSKDWYGWTKELKQIFGLDQNNEGAFLMDFTDFQDLFASLTINKVFDNYHYTSDTFRHKPDAFSIRKMTITEGISHCHIGLTQYDKRYFRNRLESEKGYNYSFARVIVGRKIDFSTIERELEEGGKFTEKVNTSYIKKMNCGFKHEYVDGVSGRMRNLTLELNLEKGEYYIIVLMDWIDEKNVLDVTLSYYGEEKVEFSRVDYRKNSQILDEIIGSHAYENIFPLETNINNVGYKNYKFFAKKEALIVEGFENTGQKALNIVKVFKDLHPIFKLARNYGNNPNIMKKPVNGSNNVKDEGLCFLKATPEQPAFICIKFTNMDKYNINGLDKNVLK